MSSDTSTGSGPSWAGDAPADELVEVELVRDPQNEYDVNAIRAEVDGTLLGHVAREVAEELAPQLDVEAAGRCTVRGLVRGGRSETSAHGAGEYGLHRWLGRVLSPAGLALSSAAARPA